MSTTDQTTELDALYEQSMKLAPAQRLELSERLFLGCNPNRQLAVARIFAR